jgi:hypothetical protein
MMTDLIKVTATRPHNNEYGDDYLKAEGESYFVPLSVAQSLFGGGWIEDFKGRTDGNENEVRGRQGTGARTGAGGKGGDAQSDGAARA